MVTKNFKSGFFKITMSLDGNTNAKYRDQNGNTYLYGIDRGAFRLRADVFAAGILVGNSNQNHLIFGTGTAAPTEDDYTLPFVCTRISGTISNTINAEDCINTINAMIKNNDTAPVTITEYGIFRLLESTTGLLLEHTLLDVPVTIQPGETATIVITREFYG